MTEKTKAPTVEPEKTDAAEALRKKTFERNKWFFTSSGIGRDMAYQLIASFLLIYIQFGVSLTLAQFTLLSIVIGVGGRIWDAINDPMMGAIIEGSHMKSGKFRPWIVIGALSCGLVIILMFNIQSLSGWSFVVFMSIMYLLWESTFTMNDIGYWSMLPSLSSKTEERNSATMLTVLFAGIGAIIAQGVIPMVTTGDMRAGYRFVGVLVGVVFIASQVMVFFGVKEPPRRANETSEKVSLKKMWFTIKSNDQVLWMTLSCMFYNVGSALLTALAANLLYMEVGYNGSLYFYVVCAYGITSVLVNVLYPAIVEKLGRKKLQVISIAIACFGYLALALMGWSSVFPFTVPLLCAFIILVSGGQSMFYMATIVNMTNCVEYNDYKLGERNEAVVSTLRPFMAKFGAALHTLIVTVVLTVSGIYGLSQSISALEAQRDFFAKADVPGQVYYIEQVQDYIDELGGLSEGAAGYDAAVEEVAAKIDADEVMNKYMIDAKYVEAIGDAIITETSGGTTTELGRLNELDAAALSEGAAYALEVGDVASGAESAVNLNFRDKGTTKMKILLRIAMTVIPVILLLSALYIQRKKFIIDEEYYDMMLEEIDKRDKSKE